MSSISVDAVASFVAAGNVVEGSSAVAARVSEIDGQAADIALQGVQQGLSDLSAAAAEIVTPAPPLDGTGTTIDRLV